MRNHALRALGLVVLALALVAAGCGGGDDEEAAGTTEAGTSATVEWAGSVCTAITTWKNELGQILDELADPSSLDEQSLEDAANDAKAATDTMVDELQSLGAPDTESGQDVEQAVDDFEKTMEDDVSEIEDTAEGISGITDLPGAITSISSSLSSMSAAFTSTLQTIEDADVQGELEDAFDESESCDELTGSSSS
jgi:hypothetical protein